MTTRSQLLLSLAIVFLQPLQAQEYTWSEHIAPIVYDNCSSCHHDGGIAPFNLITYFDLEFHANDIHHVIDYKEMPPWPADPEYRHFKEEAVLEQWEIDDNCIAVCGG